MSGPSYDHVAAKPRYQMLDVWRGIVCLVVILEHAGVALWGAPVGATGWTASIHHAAVKALGWNIGTPMFFAISGYCIAGSLVSLQRRQASPHSFLARRLWRVFPTYWAAVLMFVVVVTALDAAGLHRLHQNVFSLEIESPGKLGIAEWVGNLTLTETWRPLVFGHEANIFTRVAWSLCYQEQFYLVSMLAIVFFPKRFGRALAVLTAFTVLFRVEAWDIGFLHRIDGLFPVYWHEFAIGLAVYWRLNGPSERNVSCQRGLELFVAGMLVVACMHHDVPLIASTSLGLILIATYRWDDFTARLRLLTPLRSCGKWSYSIYLTHLLVVAISNQLLGELGLSSFWARAIVMLPLTVAGSLAVGWAFYHAVECRFLTPPQFSTLRLGARGRPYVVVLV